MKDLKQYMDERGWIGHAKKYENDWPMTNAGKFVLEFGDGCQRMSMNHIFNWVLAGNNPFEKATQKSLFYSKTKDIWLPDGEPVRHWSRLEWYGKSGTMSGDQIEPLMWACVIMDLPEVFWDMFVKLLKRGFFAWNTKKIGASGQETKIPDFMFFRLVSPLIRICMTRPLGRVVLWPVNFIWDLCFLGLNALARTVLPLFDRENTTDDLNFVVWLIGSKLISDNPASWFWRKFYVYLRPRSVISGNNAFNLEQQKWNGPQSAFNQYFNELGAPPLNDKALLVIIWL